ncbi:MAG: type II toxin-antitoxin system ParD family antitoxin [Planctomycetota bacterium]
MTSRKRISISLTPEQAAFLTGCVETGRYQSTSDVVREAIGLLEDREGTRQRAITRAQQLIEEGARQLDNGEEIDSDIVFASIKMKRGRMKNSESKR